MSPRPFYHAGAWLLFIGVALGYLMHKEYGPGLPANPTEAINEFTAFFVTTVGFVLWVIACAIREKK